MAKRIAWNKGKKLSEEYRKKLSESHRGIKYPPRSKEFRKMLSLVHEGKVVSEETRRKISVASIGRPSHNKGKTRSLEANHKQSETMKKRYPKGSAHFNFGSKRSEEAKEKMSRAKIGKYTGKENANWHGGIKKQKEKYVSILKPDHPHCNVRKHVYEHRLIVESFMGRYLKLSECVHHINKKKDDNRPENLIAFKTQSAHNAFEYGKNVHPEEIIFDGRNIHSMRP